MDRADGGTVQVGILVCKRSTRVLVPRDQEQVYVLP